ncbi:MAG: aspartyl protease family protein, partial [Akkermansiaceae bacterium]|nr:aspartyl protease family protein [Akkermansiaceae bacterium]
LIAVALLVQSLFTHSAAGQSGEVRVSSLEEAISKYTVEVPVRKAGDDHRLIAEAEVDGAKVCMVVDSGADTIIVDETVAKDKKFELRKVGTASGATGKAQTLYQAKVGIFKVGPTVIKDQSLHFLDLSSFGPLTEDGLPRGALGLGFLKAGRIVVDFDKNRLLAPKAMIEGGIAGLYRQSGYPVVPLVEYEGRFHIGAKVAGKDVYFLCDTGANGTTLRADFAKSISAVIEEREGTISSLEEKSNKQKITTIKDVVVGVATVPDMPFYVIEDSRAMKVIEGKPVVGLMGTNFFEPTHMILDFGAAAAVIAAGKPGR